MVFNDPKARAKQGFRDCKQRMEPTTATMGLIGGVLMLTPLLGGMYKYHRIRKRAIGFKATPGTPMVFRYTTRPVELPRICQSESVDLAKSI